MTTKIGWKKRLGILAVGLTANELTVQGFDSVLYPWVIGSYGFWIGGFIMIFASMLICLLTLKFYDWSQTDWLGVETLKEVREMENSKTNMFISRFLKKSRVAQFVILSLAQDPFVVTIFMRDGAHQYGVMTKKDWKNFFGSLVITNVFWTGCCWSGIAFLEKIGASTEVAIMIFSGIFILIFLAGFIIGKVSEKREVKASSVS